jgi:hypothetical protein
MTYLRVQQQKLSSADPIDTRIVREYFIAGI